MLNKEQEKVVYTRYKDVLCLAGAGAGKTKSMLSRIAHLVQTGVPSQSILVLTFTNSAALDMKQRYISEFNLPGCPEFKTFHAFCYHLLSIDQEVRSALKYTSLPSIIDEIEYKKIVKNVKMMIGSKHSINQLMSDTRDKSIQFERNTFLKALKSELIQSNKITFDILSESVCNLFTENNPVVDKYKDQYKYIFVDEFQDTDPIQYKFIQSFPLSNRFVVGDALQAIYGFRNADSSIIKNLSRDINWESYMLHHNYRSTKCICEYANDFSKYADDSYRIEMESDKEGGSVEIKSFPRSYGKKVSDQCNQNILAHLSRLKGHSAVLCRTNAEVDEVCRYLDDMNIPYYAKKKDDTPLHILKASKDDSYAMDWLSYQLDNEQYRNYLIESAKGFYYLNDFVKQFQSNWAVTKYYPIIQRLHKNWDRGVPELKYLSVLSEFNLEEPESGIHNDKELFEYFESLYSVDSATSDVYVGTIHSSKGLEYDNVFVLNVGSSTFRLSSEEDKNIFYVAITRAKTNLIIYEGGN